jgi:ABC-type nickel/cobalt efflux system permease component RcnA
MKTASITLVTLLGLRLAMPAVARDRNEHRDQHRRSERHEHEHDRDDDRGHDPFARRYPRGWEHGKKKGWGDCDAPPGQAKKQGCYEHREYHHASAPPRVIERPVVVHRPVVVNQPVATQPLPRPQAPTKKPVFVPHTPEQIREAQRQQRR